MRFKMEPGLGPRWVRPAAIAFLAWDLLGAYACVRQLRVSAGAAKLTDPYAQSLYAHLSPVYDALFVGAEICGLVGAILLLMGRPGARSWFVASLIFIALQFADLLGATDLLAHEGLRAAAFPALVLAMGAVQVWAADRARRQRRLAPARERP